MSDPDPWAELRQLQLESCRLTVDRLLDHHAEGNPFDLRAAGRAVVALADACEREGVPLTLPADFARLLGQAAAGEMPARRGPRRQFDGSGNSWAIVEVARTEFLRRREAGERYEDILNDFAETCNVSFSTAESWVRGISVPKAPK